MPALPTDLETPTQLMGVILTQSLNVRTAPPDRTLSGGG
jgi:hypothetical protein